MIKNKLPTLLDIENFVDTQLASVVIHKNLPTSKNGVAITPLFFTVDFSIEVLGREFIFMRISSYADLPEYNREYGKIDPLVRDVFIKVISKHISLCEENNKEPYMLVCPL